MSTDFISRMNAVQVQQAHAAYTQLASIYEDVAGGPYKAREFKEYFSIMDSRERLRKRQLTLIQPEYDPKQ